MGERFHLALVIPPYPVLEHNSNGAIMNEHLRRGDVVIWRFWSRDMGLLPPKPGVLLHKYPDGRLAVAYCTTDRPGRERPWSIRLTGSGLKRTSLVRLDRVDVRKPDEHVPVAGHLPEAVFRQIADMHRQYMEQRRKV